MEDDAIMVYFRAINSIDCAIILGCTQLSKMFVQLSLFSKRIIFLAPKLVLPENKNPPPTRRGTPKTYMRFGLLTQTQF